MSQHIKRCDTFEKRVLAVLDEKLRRILLGQQTRQHGSMIALKQSNGQCPVSVLSKVKDGPGLARVSEGLVHPVVKCMRMWGDHELAQWPRSRANVASWYQPILMHRLASPAAGSIRVPRAKKVSMIST